MDSYTFLRKVPLFAELPDSDLEKLCETVYEVRLSQGELLFTEGSPGEHAYVIKEGQIEIYKEASGKEIQLAVRMPGEVIGEIALLENTNRNASGRAMIDSLVLSIGREQMDLLLNTSSSAARTMLHTIASRLQSTELALRQSEKMAQLGTLTAGIAHELNNPAAAIGRGAEQMKTTFGQLQRSTLALYAMGLTAAQMERMQVLEEQIRRRSMSPVEVDPLTRSDREALVEEWLEGRGVASSWELAPQLVDLDIAARELESLEEVFSGSGLRVLLQWMAASYDIYCLLDEIWQGSGRVSEIVKALKSYVYLDQGPVQEVSIHEGLDNTLVILRHKLKQGIEVRREYDPAVPRIQAYGSELNQAWTNIIDNAIDAVSMNAPVGAGESTFVVVDVEKANPGASPAGPVLATERIGKDGENPPETRARGGVAPRLLIIRTKYNDPWVVVDIQDNGPGIPPEVLPKLFSPFFTTKPMGKGTGLGLNISYNIIKKHGGDIKVISKPGETHFEVWLPVDAGQASGRAPQEGRQNDDNRLREILETTRTIAVVGISDKPEKPNHTIPAYLQQQGYRILPVNPRLEEVLGVKAYPDLRAVPEAVDTVLIFRPAEYAPEIVEQAVAIGAKVVWMQEGIANEAAARQAAQAGIEVVMDTCMRKTHQRLIGEKH